MSLRKSLVFLSLLFFIGLGCSVYGVFFLLASDLTPDLISLRLVALMFCLSGIGVMTSASIQLNSLFKENKKKC